MAAAGVDERADHRLRRAAAGEPGLELGLPGVERGAARLRVGGTARAVDDLVGGAHVAVERVRGRTDLLRQPARRPVVGRIVAPVHPPAGLVRARQRRIDRAESSSLRPHDGGLAARQAAALRHRQGRGRQDDRLRGARAGGRARPGGARSSARSPSRSGCRAPSSARASSARPRSSSPTNLWAITIDPNLALQEWLSKQLGGGPPVRLLARSSALPVLRRRRAGRAR